MSPSLLICFPASLVFFPLEMKSAAVPILENLSLHSLTLVGDLPDAFACGVCLGVLENPVQCSNGHLMCRDCAKQVLKKAKNCPMCRCPMSAGSLIRPPGIVSDALGNLVVYCPRSEAGAGSPKRAKKKNQENQEEGALKVACVWMGPHRDLETHLKNDCAHALRKCSLCNEQMAQSLMEHHTQQECAERLMPCAFCKIDFKVAELKEHEDVCDMSPHVVVSCVCGAKLARGQLDDHIKNDIHGHFKFVVQNGTQGAELEAIRTQNQTLVAQNKAQGAEVKAIRTQNQTLVAQNKAQGAELEAIRTQNQAFEARLDRVEQALPGLFIEFEIWVPVEFEGEYWIGLKRSFGGIDFHLEYNRSRGGLYLYSNVSKDASEILLEMTVSCFVNGMSLLSSPVQYRSDGMLFHNGKWQQVGRGRNNWTLPTPVNGFHQMAVKLGREK